MKPGRSQAFRRSVAISVSVSYLTTQVFFSSGFTPTASAAGMPDVWKDRAASLSHKRNTPSLSLSLTSPTSLPLKAFPAVDPLLQVTAPFLRVQSVHAGRANAPAVLLVQDVHLNAPAQRNIGLALNRISGRGVVINVEAAHGKFDFAPHRQFPDPAVRKEIADFLLRENFISAVSWMGLTAPVTPSTVGVDDASLYVQNVEAFKAAARIKDRALGQIHKNAGALAARRQHILSPTLNSLSNKIVAYHKGEVPIHEFASALSSYVSVGAASSVAKLMEATRLEKSLDNAAAQRERNELLQKLSNNRRVSSELVALGAAFQSGAMDAMMFHVALSKLFAREGVDLASAPHFDRYLRYVTLADGIDHSKLFQELSAMTEAAINTPAAT